MKRFILTITILFIVSTTIVDANVMNRYFPINDEGRYLFVGGTGPGNYSTIQSALDNASGGDTVFVYSGTYSFPEDIGIYTSIRVIGENAESVIVENLNRLKTWYIFADQVCICNFSFHNICMVNYGNSVSIASNIFRIEQFKFEASSGVIDSNGNEYNTFSGNTFILEDRPDERLKPICGMSISHETHGTISHNHISNALVGMDLSSSESLCVSENTLTGSKVGLSILSSFTNYDGHHISNNNFLNNEQHASVTYSVSNTSFRIFISNLLTRNVPHQNFTHNYWDDHQSSSPRKIDARYYVHVLEFFNIYIIDITFDIPKYEVDPDPASSPFLVSYPGSDNS